MCILAYKLMEKNYGIGGIMIESSMGSVGHSDGDGLIHAICDSLLGASGLGDIGLFFPSDDKKWKNAQSHLFLTEVNKMVLEAGYYISNRVTGR